MAKLDWWSDWHVLALSSASHRIPWVFGWWGSLRGWCVQHFGFFRSPSSCSGLGPSTAWRCRTVPSLPVDGWVVSRLGVRSATALVDGVGMNWCSGMVMDAHDSPHLARVHCLRLMWDGGREELSLNEWAGWFQPLRTFLLLLQLVFPQVFCRLYWKHGIKQCGRGPGIVLQTMIVVKYPSTLPGKGILLNSARFVHAQRMSKPVPAATHQQFSSWSFSYPGRCAAQLLDKTVRPCYLTWIFKTRASTSSALLCK